MRDHFLLLLLVLLCTGCNQYSHQLKLGLTYQDGTTELIDTVIWNRCKIARVWSGDGCAHVMFSGCDLHHGAEPEKLRCGLNRVEVIHYHRGHRN